MNMIGGYLTMSVSGQVSLHMKLEGNHQLELYERIDLWVCQQVGERTSGRLTLLAVK